MTKIVRMREESFERFLELAVHGHADDHVASGRRSSRDAVLLARTETTCCLRYQAVTCRTRLQCSIAAMASMTWRTASFSASVRCGFQQSINRIKRGWSERFQASCS